MVLPVPTPDAPAPAAAMQAPVSALPMAFQQFALNGKVAVVTGGAQGLGYSMAASLCSAGLVGIAILDINPLVGEPAAISLNEQFGTNAKFFRVDVTDELMMKSTFGAINDEFGSIDVVVCSAGVVDNYNAEDYPYAKFQRLMNINLGGSFLAAQSAFPYMRANGGGSIIFIGSMSGHVVNFPQPQIAYNASKAGVIHMMKSFAVEWAKYKIRCNSISPGYMHTGLIESFDQNWVNTWKSMTPMARMGEPHELQGAALWLASNASTFVTGTDVTVDGGYTAM
ncbi:uncharacterized protein V2V93DRAFT_363693 [Kockiozyma suomiensis]|uniref:uncharacterized protein n=1 Tax=Kockiozyma suomiensis TaxID=1337062 RepID=UPI0033432064